MIMSSASRCTGTAPRQSLAALLNQEVSDSRRFLAEPTRGAPSFPVSPVTSPSPPPTLGSTREHQQRERAARLQALLHILDEAIDIINEEDDDDDDDDSDNDAWQ
jgi:hypothetical protein